MRLLRFIPGGVLAAATLASAPAMAQSRPTPPPVTVPRVPGGQPPQAAEPAERVEAIPTTPRVWEIEVHGAVGSVLDRRAGSGSLPVTGAVVQGLLSASTFYLGEGARLFNENQAARSSGPPIVALDGVAGGSAISRKRSVIVGARVDRRLTPRLGIEIAGEYRRGRLAFRPEALSGIEASRASVKSAVEGALSRFAAPTAVTSTATITDAQRATQLVATASLIVRVREAGRVMPYVAIGGGVLANDSTSPSAILVGTYHVGNPAQLTYADRVALRYQEEDRAFLGVAGGGVKIALSPRWGIRFDARANVYKDTGVHLVDASPETARQSTGQPFPILTSGTLQFSPIAPLTSASSVDHAAFRGSGFQTHIVVSSGLFLRF